MPPPRRGAATGAAGEALAAAPAPDPDAVAYHFRRAGDDRAVGVADAGGGAGAARLRVGDRGGTL